MLEIEDNGYAEINPFLSARSTNSALFLILRDFMISYLWNITVAR